MSEQRPLKEDAELLAPRRDAVRLIYGVGMLEARSTSESGASAAHVTIRERSHESAS